MSSSNNNDDFPNSHGDNNTYILILDDEFDIVRIIENWREKNMLSSDLQNRVWPLNIRINYMKYGMLSLI